MIVIGDHQPPAAVSGRTASHEVPVHQCDEVARPAGFELSSDDRRTSLID
jgi:hypothetical protein